MFREVRADGPLPDALERQAVQVRALRIVVQAQVQYDAAPAVSAHGREAVRLHAVPGQVCSHRTPGRPRQSS